MRISDWSSDVCSSDLGLVCSTSRWSNSPNGIPPFTPAKRRSPNGHVSMPTCFGKLIRRAHWPKVMRSLSCKTLWRAGLRSEEHTSELQSLMRISYAVFCLQKKNKIKDKSILHENNDI